MSKVTKRVVKYPENQEPTFTIPETYSSDYRIALGHITDDTKNPLVAIAMNPSAANEETSDSTANRVINASIALRYDGWVIVNLYPERATDTNDMHAFNQKLHEKNLTEISKLLKKLNVKEV